MRGDNMKTYNKLIFKVVLFNRIDVLTASNMFGGSDFDNDIGNVSGDWTTF